LLTHSSDNTVEGNVINSNKGYGIHLYYSNSSNTLTGNTVNSNDYGGIRVLYSDNTTLTNNTVNGNNGDGIEIYRSHSNSLTANTVNSNNTYGIFLDVSNLNTMTGNAINSNYYDGICLWRGSGHTLSGNTINLNNGYGIYVGYAYNNQIYNNIFNNVIQAGVLSASGNVFNLPAPIGGNYWSDWTGPDADNDGFVDLPYVFMGGLDNLPWVVQDGWAVLTPQEAIEQIIAEVATLGLQKGIENSLDAKLDAAFKALDDVNENNDVAAINALQAFINSVEAQRGNKIPEADADALIDVVLDIIDLLLEE